MNKYTLVPTIVIGAGLGALAMHSLQAQTRLPVYLVSEIDVIDTKAFKEYSPKAANNLKEAGARYLARGGKIVSIEGETPKRFVLLQFESMEAAEAWRNSTATKEISDLQKRAIKRRAFLVQGLGN